MNRSRRQRPVVSYVVFTTFGSVLTQAEFRRPDDLVLMQRQRSLLRVVALERCVKRVYVPGNRRGPSRAVLDRSLARACPSGGAVEDLVEEGSEGWQGDECDGYQVLDDGADCRFPESPGIVVGEDALERDCFRDRAACGERAEADETAKSGFRAHIHLQPVQYEDWDNSADEIGESIKSKPDIAHQVGDVRRKAFAMNVGVPDCGHRPALHEK